MLKSAFYHPGKNAPLVPNELEIGAQSNPFYEAKSKYRSEGMCTVVGINRYFLNTTTQLQFHL